MSAKIFLTGATGYLGGTVLAQLLNFNKVKASDITILVRSPEKAKTFQSKFGVQAAVGSHSDLDKIEGLAAAADIVIQVSNSDDVPLTEAILKGQKAKYTKTGVRPILIHTSGTAFITDNARGETATDKFYDDTDVEELKAIPPSALHRNVDLLILGADGEGYINSHIITPATIYGKPDHPVAKAGLTNMHSIQIPAVMKASLARGRAGVIGSGKPIWAASHVEDVAQMYIVLLGAVLADHDLSHGYSGFYYVGNDEYTWYDASKKIGEAMVELGLSTEAEPTSFTPEERGKFFWSEELSWLWGTNCRVKAARGTGLGWKPTHTTADLLASLKPEVEALAKNLW